MLQSSWTQRHVTQWATSHCALAMNSASRNTVSHKSLCTCHKLSVMLHSEPQVTVNLPWTQRHVTQWATNHCALAMNSASCNTVSHKSLCTCHELRVMLHVEPQVTVHLPWTQRHVTGWTTSYCELATNSASCYTLSHKSLCTCHELSVM